MAMLPDLHVLIVGAGTVSVDNELNRVASIAGSTME